MPLADIACCRTVPNLDPEPHYNSSESLSFETLLKVSFWNSFLLGCSGERFSSLHTPKGSMTVCMIHKLWFTVNNRWLNRTLAVWISVRISLCMNLFLNVAPLLIPICNSLHERGLPVLLDQWSTGERERERERETAGLNSAKPFERSMTHRSSYVYDNFRSPNHFSLSAEHRLGTRLHHFFIAC